MRSSLASRSLAVLALLPLLALVGPPAAGEPPSPGEAGSLKKSSDPEKSGVPEKGGDPEKSGWFVRPDPGLAFKGPFNLRFGAPVAFQGTYVFPTTPSPFVAVNPPGTKDVYQVYDLRTMRPVGKPVAIPHRFLPFTQPVLSPDGKYLAARVRVGGAALRLDAPTTIEVWSTATGKSVRKLPAEANNNIKPRYYDLLGKGRLWVAKHPDEHPLHTVRTTFQVYDVASGKEKACFHNPLVPLGKWATFSAGGRYQWMEQTGGWFLFLVWDLNTGKLVGKRELQPKEAPFGQAAGLAFSPDGTEMAMLWRVNKRPDTWGRLLVFDTTTGRQLHDHRIGYDPPHIDSLWELGETRCLQWWPEKRGWLLFGHLLVDRESGAVVHKLGPAPAFALAVEDRRFLSPFHVTYLEGVFDKQLKVAMLPRREIEAAVKKARGK
jgi:hypothetical protein